MNMLFDAELTLASHLCISHNLPFAVVALPGSDNVEFYAGETTAPVDVDGSQEDVFFLNSYGNPWKFPLGITKSFSANEIIGRYGKCQCRDSGTALVMTDSTIKEGYITGLHELIKTLKVRGGKTVISRVICGKTQKSWATTAEEYFSAFPGTFRALYYTPLTGGWLVASPELLLGATAGHVETMSLAGTRECSDGACAWDQKNVEEHDYVTRFIVDCFRNKGIEPLVSDAESVQFGNIEHLCHRITGVYSGKLLPLIHALSPTPALAGEPRDTAMAEIARIEQHDRKCYGGYVGIKKNDTVMVYANLRCLNFDGENYCIYAGGGITRDSVPEKEWEETENKSRYLRSLLETAWKNLKQNLNSFL